MESPAPSSRRPSLMSDPSSINDPVSMETVNIESALSAIKNGPILVGGDLYNGGGSFSLGSNNNNANIKNSTSSSSSAGTGNNLRRSSKVARLSKRVSKFIKDLVVSNDDREDSQSEASHLSNDTGKEKKSYHNLATPKFKGKQSHLGFFGG